MNNDTRRRELLSEWARRIEGAAVRGLFGRPIAIQTATPINGPRAGALEFGAGFDAGVLLKALQVNERATLRQLIPWPFVGEPVCFMSERAVRVEAGWPRDLADDNITLHELGQHPTGGGRWLVGRNERGNVPTIGLDDMTPHWLFSGTTGSGKTTAMVSAIGQLARDEDNRFVLIDVAKVGASFERVSNIRGRVGPVCADPEAARAALAWSVRAMTERYGGARDRRRLIVCVDELQNVAEDQTAAESLRRLVEQGRGVGVHVLGATQHPTVDNLGGPSVARNFVGRFALRVIGFEASRVAVGGKSPRADYLLGRGDSYVCKPGVVHRCQVAVFDGDINRGEPDLSEWPEGAGELPSVTGWPSGSEVGAALVSAARGDGRVKFQRALSESGLSAANDKAVRLLGLARDTLAWLDDRGLSVRPSDDTDTLDPDENA